MSHKEQTESKRAEARFTKLGKLDAEALGDCLASHNERIRALAESYPAEFAEALGDCIADMEDPADELDRIVKALDSWLPGFMRSNPALNIPAPILEALERYDLIAPCPNTLDLFQADAQSQTMEGVQP
jgi:predicted TIM-barrel fold metal-dependent hydrolase